MSDGNLIGSQPRESARLRRTIEGIRRALRQSKKTITVPTDGDYSSDGTERLILAEPKSGGNSTVTLPLVADVPDGYIVSVKNTDSAGTYNVVVSRAGSDTIDNALTTVTLGALQYTTLGVGTPPSGSRKWHIIT